MVSRAEFGVDTMDLKRMITDGIEPYNIIWACICFFGFNAMAFPMFFGRLPQWTLPPNETDLSRHPLYMLAEATSYPIAGLILVVAGLILTFWSLVGRNDTVG